jgi:hypothetical protein
LSSSSWGVVLEEKQTDGRSGNGCIDTTSTTQESMAQKMTMKTKKTKHRSYHDDDDDDDDDDESQSFGIEGRCIRIQVGFFMSQQCPSNYGTLNGLIVVHTWMEVGTLIFPMWQTMKTIHIEMMSISKYHKMIYTSFSLSFAYITRFIGSYTTYDTDVIPPTTSDNKSKEDVYASN